MSYKDKKAAQLRNGLLVLRQDYVYLQPAQVHVEPQVQLTKVQFGLLHFTFWVA